MGVAAKYAFAIVVLMFCFTAGFGLKCFDCTAPYRNRDDCNIGRGMPEKICDIIVLWGEIEAAAALLDSTRRIQLLMPAITETTHGQNLACIKMIYRNATGEDQIGRGCTFKKFDGVDGCELSEQLVHNLRLVDGADHRELKNLTEEIARRYPKPSYCRVCDTDLCNATIGLTPAFFIYPPLCLLVLIKCKLFYQ